METTMTAHRIDRASTDTTTIYSEGGDLVFERTFDASREQVWKAMTDPELVPRWWGQHGTTTTVIEMDVRPGGTWRYVSSAPDREDIAFVGSPGGPARRGLTDALHDGKGSARAGLLRRAREMASPAGFEPATGRLEGGCSGPLSYGDNSGC